MISAKRRWARKDAIRAQYEEAYRKDAGLGDDFSGWEDQGAWLEP